MSLLASLFSQVTSSSHRPICLEYFDSLYFFSSPSHYHIDIRILFHHLKLILSLLALSLSHIQITYNYYYYYYYLYTLSYIWEITIALSFIFVDVFLTLHTYLPCNIIASAPDWTSEAGELDGGISL
jgi:hypothetical protein